MSASCPYCRTDISIEPAEAWQLAVSFVPKSANKRVGNHRREYRKWRDDARFVFGAMKRGMGIPDATKLRRVVFVRRFATGRRWDKVNFAHACKPILDALVLEKLLKNDSPRWCEDFYHQEIGADYDEILIRLEELP